MRVRGFTILTIALAGGFLYGLWWLYQLRFEAGDIYPPYSSLRADPLGAKALFESIQQLPGISAARNYRPVASLAKMPATVLFLGVDSFAFENATEEQIKEYEALAAGGARVVIAMRPLRRVLEPVAPPGKPGAKQPPVNTTPPEQPSIQKRWGISIDYIGQSGKQADEEGSGEPKVTALYFRADGRVLHEVERRFGSGSVVLLANSYPWSNEALAGERDVPLLSRILARHPLVIFDESHFGLTESGSVGALVRKYHLEGAVAVLAVLLALFVWKNSTSFLPARSLPEGGEVKVEAKDAGAGLANLLRRNIPAQALLQTCWNEWEGSRHGGRHYSHAKMDRARALMAEGRDAAETYREVSRILAKRT
jgi:hypothetical protein